jgi:hypothetical protein
MSIVFYTALVGASDTTFLTEYEREDLPHLSLECEHREGEFPMLTLEIKNPYVGLLSHGRPTWLWLAWLNPTTNHVDPLFFGRLVGLPKVLVSAGFAETLKVQFIARSVRWLVLKQALAEQLKVAPNYDPLFVSTEKRDDPDTVLEGYSGLYHWPRLPTSSPTPDLYPSLSDYLQAEDGTEVFQETDTIYDSVEYDIGQQPLTVVYMKSQVHWTQQSAGTIDFGAKGLVGYTAASLAGDWPKSGAQLDGGYSVAAGWAFCNDQYQSPAQHNYNYQNTANTHITGDVMSVSQSITTFPVGGDAYMTGLVTQAGIVNPTAYPSLAAEVAGELGVNIPLHVAYSITLVCSMGVSTYLSLNYEAIRPRTEFLEFQLTSNLQPILTDPNEPASLDTETVTLAGGDVGQPIQNVLSWYSLTSAAGWSGTVLIGTYVKSTQEFIGPTVYSVCVASTGNVGSDEPIWSDVIGTVVTDGSVTWASLGTTLVSDYQTWQQVAGSQGATVQLGTVIKSMYFLPAPVDLGGIPCPASSATIMAYQVCTQEGITQAYSTGEWTGLADLYPRWPSPFTTAAATAGFVTTDGTVEWTSLGDGGGVITVPLGLDLGQRSYFSTDRGQQSISYLISVARARLLRRARCVEVTFQCRFELAIALSCRMGALVYDHRFPGGRALGKIISYSFSANGVDELIGKVTIGCSAGFGEVVIPSAGTGTYAAPGYMQSGYQQMINEIIVISEVSDVGYTRPLDATDDDGIMFPITDKSQVVVKDTVIVGTPPGAAAQEGGTTQTITNTMTWNNSFGGAGSSTSVEFLDVPNGFAVATVPQETRSWNWQTGQSIVHNTETILVPNTQYYLELKPLQGMSFSAQYNIATTPLSVPAGVNLEAASSP